ncbi:MAG: retroviral-like aspartic protease [Acidobacteria bacterium]|nr:retroviral-like aspartic protease [Acidobacteriota bacterium]MBI3425061.1 retroviral-like aspartic protease [Acidobacteriota bacterium]
MVLTQSLNFRGSKGRADLLALFDSGSTYSCLNPEVAAKLGNLEALPDPLEVKTADKGHFIRIEESVRLDFYLNNLRLTDEFMVVPGLAEEAIIGATTMQKWRIKLDFEHDQIVTDPRANRMILM